jgi:hypothetical protein
MPGTTAASRLGGRSGHDIRGRTLRAFAAVGLAAGLALAPTGGIPGPASAASTTTVAPGPWRTIQADYDLGRTGLSVLGADGRPHALPTRLVGEITVPVGTTGPLPVVVILHGAHQSCIEGPDGTESSDYPCPPGWETVASYTGYRYLARLLASHGVIVASVDGRPVSPFDHTDRPFPDGAAADVPTWMDLRARIVDAQVRRLVRAGAGETGPDVDFGVPLAGRVDPERVGLVGHSRGGEGVVWAELLAGPRPYAVRTVVAIAPTDFARRIVSPDVPFSVLLPTCDGDVSDLQGAAFYDDARNTLRTAPLLQVAIHGANHGFFNTVWPDELGPTSVGQGPAAPPIADAPSVPVLAPGVSPAPDQTTLPLPPAPVDPTATPGPAASPSSSASPATTADPGASPLSSASPEPSPSGGPAAPSWDTYCASSAIGDTRLTRARQEVVGAAIVSDLVLGTLLDEPALLARMGVGAVPPTSVAGVPLTVRAQMPTADRLDVAPLAASPYDLAETARGGRITPARLDYFTLCTPDASSTSSTTTTTCPPTAFVQAQVAPELRVGWRSRAARLRLALSPRPEDVRTMEGVSLSVAVTPAKADPDLNDDIAPRPFTVVLVDASGHRAGVAVPATLPAVRPWPTTTVLGTVRIPLAWFHGIDLSRVAAVELDFDRASRGALVVSDIAFVR